MTTNARCPLCGRNHARCEFGRGLVCRLGAACENPHHGRVTEAGLCDYCGGLLWPGNKRHDHAPPSGAP